MGDKCRAFLIVEDEQDICWALDHILGKNGFPSRKGLNGEEALRLMESVHHPEGFRLVFLDAKLPDIEGLELARRIRDLDPSIPIVMISGYFYRDDQAIQEALADGLIRAFIAKPFAHDDVLNAIRAFCPLDHPSAG